MFWTLVQAIGLTDRCPPSLRVHEDGFDDAVTTASFTSVNTLSSPLEQDLRAAFQTICKPTFGFLDIERSDAREARGLARFLSFARSLDELDLTLSTDFLHHNPSGRRSCESSFRLPLRVRTAPPDAAVLSLWCHVRHAGRPRPTFLRTSPR